MGKQKSHEILYQASMTSFENEVPLYETLLNNREIKQYLSEDEISDLLEPVKHVGLSMAMTDNVIARTKR